MTANGWAQQPGLARRLFARLAAGNRTPTTVGPVPGTISGPPTTPPEDWNGTGTTAGGEPVVPVPSIRGGAGGPQHPAAAPETIICSACGQLLEDRTTARCWMAPDGTVAAADLACLLWLGETELGLAE